MLSIPLIILNPFLPMEERVEFPQVMSKGSQHNQMCRKFMHPMFTVALFINMIAQT